MTDALAIYAKGTNRYTDSQGERITLPSDIATDDCEAAWDFYTLEDCMGNGWDLTLGSKITRIDAGGIHIGDTGVQSYATCNGLMLTPHFAVIIVFRPGASTGTLFGNYATDGSVETGLRIYTASGSIVARIGNETGRASLDVTLSGWIAIGVAFDGATITVCTMTGIATGTETSSLGTEPCRIGRSISGSAPAAGGADIAGLYVFSTDMTVDEMRVLMPIADAKRIRDAIV